MPASVESIGNNALGYCASLKTVIIENNSLLKSIEGKCNDKA